MERRLSAAQRDTILLQEAKEDRMFRRELTDALKSSTHVFASALDNMSKSMAQMGSVFAQSMALFNGGIENNPRTYHPNIPITPTAPHSNFGIVCINKMNILSQFTIILVILVHQVILLFLLSEQKGTQVIMLLKKIQEVRGIVYY